MLFILFKIVLDRVLYPPRRKAGRPSTKSTSRKPGRPLKHRTKRSGTVSCKSSLKTKKPIPNKRNTRRRRCNKLSNKDVLQLNSLQLSEKRKETENTESKPKKTLKSVEVVKKPTFLKPLSYSVVQTKRKHHKHKIRHRHRTLAVLKNEKPKIVDPKVLSEIDKLVTDFIKYCNIGSNKSFQNKIPEIFKCVKRVSKKRKASENIDGRKKKKQITVTPNNSEGKETNEQRLPLKKRHYHVSSSNPENISTSSTDSGKANDLESKTAIPEPTSSITSDSQTSASDEPPTTANDGDVKDIHIQEAIEACIHKYASSKVLQAKLAESAKLNLGVQLTVSTTNQNHNHLKGMFKSVVS